MNERIKELAEEAAWKTRMTHNNAYWRMQEMAEDSTWREKFAELIVRECADIANKQFSAASGLDDRDCWSAAEIKKHFGVEE